MLKRNLGRALRGRSHPAQMRDLHLRVLNDNLMLALLWLSYRALPSPLDRAFELAERPPTYVLDPFSSPKLLREDLGIRSTIPPGHGRPPKDPSTLPKDKYRRLMKHRFKDGKRPKVYGQRSQVETVFSMLKRNLGSALRGRSHPARMRDLHLRVLTHNLMLALLWVFYRAYLTPFLLPARLPFALPVSVSAPTPTSSLCASLGEDCG